jgi:uncharacterized protein
MRFSEYAFLLVFFALTGWALEVVFRSFQARTFVNPGFLRGPYLPVYGIGAVALTFFATHLQGDSLFIKGSAYFLLTTGLEFITGFIFEGCLHMRLWDYSDQRFKIKNYVCLQFSFYWLIMAFAFEYLVLPLYLLFFGLLNPVVVSIFAIVIPAIMSADCTFRLAEIIGGKRKKKDMVSYNYEAEFMDILRSLIENPLIQRLTDFEHHRNKTRLDHSIEVAWRSFLLSKKFSLDCAATARGALLHDLFFYDWLREGPRLHGFRHPWISLKNAREVTTLSKKERDIIVKHMWPLTVIPPRYMESWIVCMVDTFCSLKDYGTYTSKKLKAWNQG